MAVVLLYVMKVGASLLDLPFLESVPLMISALAATLTVVPLTFKPFLIQVILSILQYTGVELSK